MARASRVRSALLDWLYNASLRDLPGQAIMDEHEFEASVDAEVFFDSDE